MSDDIIRNEYGEVVFMSSTGTGARVAGLDGQTHIQVANSYVRQHMAEMGLLESRLEDDEAAFRDASRENDPVISVAREKDIAGARVVVYEQSIDGMAVYDAHMGVQITEQTMAVTSLQSSMHQRINIVNPKAKSKQKLPKKLSRAALKKMLGINLENLGEGNINRQVVYRFEPDLRLEQTDDTHQGCFSDHHANDELSLPELSSEFSKGNHYIVNEVLFRASRNKEEAAVNWRALVEPESGSVLYIRALVACVTGMVFVRDPQTQTGANVSGASSNAVLNPFRSSISLPGIVPDTPQSLSGEYVELAETSAPVIPAPTVPNPAGLFNYDVRTDDFSAVNAYYHCDNLFRTMADYGFDIPDYFSGTQFPVPVDHRALGNAVNAQAPGNVTGTGLGELRFALLQAGQPVGISTSNRVVWHEFGHGLLWDHVNSPNFGFAHSAGDSLAAILNDPGSNEPDRFDTFPWVQQATPLGRRHDRAISDGWAWFGPQYNTQYQGEQILCTTLFRLYQSLGGDSNSLTTQTRAAQTTAYLIFKAIGLLTSTTQFPEVFVNNMQNADVTTTNFKGIPGGGIHKVIRWAFEKQGLFQPDARPGMGNIVNSEGNPPDVDVYIDDGRQGEYQYLANHWSCQDMWVRHSADGGLVHQNPVVGVTNHMYVRVKNRGLQFATNVNVAAYHCLPGMGLSFPDDWTAMDTANLPAGNIAPGGETIVGPFEFVPTQVGHECLLAIAQALGDPGNDTTITGTIPEHRFVPFDNNTAQRNVSPVFPSLHAIVKKFHEHPIWIRNPYRQTAVCIVESKLPRFLQRLGWELKVISQGGSKFELGPRDRAEVVLRMEPGEPFSEEQAKNAIEQGDNEIIIHADLNQERVGGMTYPITFNTEKEDDQFDRGNSGVSSNLYTRSVRSGNGEYSTLGQVVSTFANSGTDNRQSILDRRVSKVRIEFDLD